MPWARVYFVEAPVPVPEIAALTDATGTVLLELPVPGLYRVGLAAESFEPKILEVELGEESSLSVTIELESSGRIPD